MESSHNIYITKAQEAIECVYESEYHNSLGIPLPIIELLLADDPHFSTGEYYITINNTWQIHLKFGQLPISYKVFQDEVKVITRHEIGHYMCCPYDAITQFRMLKCILNIYENEYQQIKLNQIDHLCRDLANQFADIIVDTRNFLLNPDDTLKSEVNWIKKCGGLMSSPPSSKLMFLTKEILWGHSLEINEKDENLLSQINDLAIKLKEGGIENRSLFLPKLEEYTRLFFNLLHNDIRDNRFNQQGSSQNGQQQGNQQGSSQNGQQQGNQQGGSQNGQQQGSQQGDSQNGQQQGNQQGGSQNGQQQGNQQGNSQNGQQQGNQQGSSQNGQQQGNQQGNSQNGQQQGNTKPTPKDGDKSGNAIVFSDPDKVKDAIEQLASETSVEEFIRLLQMAGIEQLSDKEKEMLWFSVQSSDMIVIDEDSNKGSKDNYTYPTAWKIGDPISEIDMMLSLSTASKIIPGITTKKWEMSTNNYLGAEKNQRDLLLVVDTSGSMGSVLNENSNMHQAVKAAFGILIFFESKKSQVALIEFSDRITAEIDWTNKYDDVRERLLVNGNGGTTFPIKKIKEFLETSSNQHVSVLITDGDLGNYTEALNYFREYLNEDNKLFVFLLGNSKNNTGYAELAEIGAHVYSARCARDFCAMVLDDID